MNDITRIDAALEIFRIPRRHRKMSDAGRLFELLAAIVRRQPQRIASVALVCIRESLDAFPGLDSALAFLPMEDWSSLVAEAVSALVAHEENETAWEIIERASLQAPHTTHPFLEQLFTTGGMAASQAFREAQLEDIRFLFAYCQTATDLRSAYNCLLETRLPDALRFVQAHSSSFVENLPEIGFEASDNGFRKLYPDTVYHISFPSDYAGPVTSLWLDFDYSTWLEHPTWARFALSGVPYAFGGASDFLCGVCGKQAHHLISLDPIPPGLGVTDLTVLHIATCLSCLGWERSTLSYEHKSSGILKDLNFTEQPIEPQFPASPLLGTTVSLATLEPRWRWQEWGTSNDRENLNRVGGHPSWIQGGAYPSCPQCSRTASFLLQIDSELPTAAYPERSPNYTGWLWGSGGICYVFWCDTCKVSTLFWQCT
jgi:hypothetical protein